MAGYDPNDPSASERSVDDYLGRLDNPPSRPRVGLIRNYFLQECDDETRGRTEAAARQLAKAGALVEEVSMPECFSVARVAQRVVMSSETAAFHESAMRDEPASYAPGLRASIQVALTIPASYYLQAQRIRRQFRADLEKMLSTYDVLLTPSTPEPAPKGLRTTGNAMFQSPWTLAGLPALSIPVGLSKGGLPLGVQLIGNAFGEAKLLGIGRWCEETIGVDLCPPIAR
jgi:aspartyl-tRNA(Asn)/glutamyl-tRNA(Gln) amidotransferase subunit A